MNLSGEMQEKLEQVDELLAQGHTLREATSRVGVNVATYTCWLAQHGGRVAVPLDRLEHLYAENSRLRRVVARLNLELKTLKGRPRIDFFSKPLNTRAS
ncbi:MAG TPA: transposase [Aestuariivirgaceae bacterium]|nr:transposase [Aestuariivirgaceae bacterium]